MSFRCIPIATAAIAVLTLGVASPGAHEAQQTPYPTLASGDQQRDRSSQPDPSMKDRMKSPPQEVTGKKPVRMVVVASAEQILSNPRLYYDVPVSVHAGVGEVMGPQVFTLDEDSWLDANWFGQDLIVVNPRPATAGGAALREDAYVTVVGTLRQFIRAEIERDFSWFDSVPDYDLEMDGRPIIIADSIRTSQGTQMVQDPPSETQLLVTTPGRIAEIPSRYYGRSVSVHAEVEDVMSRRLFSLDEDRLFAGPDVLVLNPFPAVNPDDDEIVTVVGTVRPFVASEFERDYDWFDVADLGADVGRYERRPVIVAHSILGERQWVVLRPELTLDRSEEMMARRSEERQRQASAGQSRSSTGQAGAGTQEQGTAGTSGEGPILDLAALTDVSDPGTIVQRQVNLTGVQIQSVVDDQTVWVGPSADRRVLVLIPAGTTTPGGLAEGQRVRIEGTVVGPEAVPQGVQARYAVRAHSIEQQ